jgi:putative ABC transport system permease protein
VLPLRDWVLQSRVDAGRGRFLLFGVTAFVLLLATANVASLSVARARTRAFEASVRSALGATRGRLVRQFLTETLALALLGGSLGVGFAMYGIDAAGQALGANQAGFAVRLDPRVLTFALFATILAAALAGVAPASYGARDRVFALLGQKGGRHDAGGARVQSGLVALEIACSLMLLTGGGVLVKELLRLRGEPGFDPRGLYLVQLSRPDIRDALRRRDHARSAATELTGTPGTVEIGLTGQPATNVPIRLESSDRALEPSDAPSVVLTDSAFFAVTSIEPVRGRLFQSTDRFGAAQVAVVNEAAAERLWPGEEAIGKRLAMGDSAPTLVHVVGVIRNARVFNAPLKRDAPAIVYRPFDQMPTSYPIFIVRGMGGSGQVVPALRRTLAQLTGTIAEPSAVASIADLQDREIAAERMHALSISAFAIMGLFLAAVGVFGIVSYAASLRQHEFSIRMALGASPREVAITVVRSGALAASLGLVLGVSGSILLGRALSALLSDANPLDPSVLWQAMLILAVVLAAAVCMPAWRASRIDPALALRA